MKMEQTECSETSAYKIQMLGNYPEESIQHSEHGESLKSFNLCLCLVLLHMDMNRYILYIQKLLLHTVLF